MLANKTADAPLTAEHRASFFRQSGWLMIANIGGGFFMWAVHLLNQAVPPGAYGDFGAFLAVIMLVPTIPLQMILAQQTAKELALDRTAELSALIRWIWRWTTILWVVLAFVIAVFQKSILAFWQMTDPTGIWITMAIVLMCLWMPVFMGTLQGRQNFLWLGWTMMSNGLGRVSLAAFAVLVLHAYRTGMIAGVLFGVIIATLIGAWHSRSLWLTPPRPFNRPALLRQIIPLFIGFLGFQILFTADTILVRAYFKSQSDYYVSAGTLSRALMWLVLPLAAVMFPKIVHSAARSQKTNLVPLVLLGTAILAVVGAAGLALLGPWVVPLIYKDNYRAVASALLPWYAFAMVPLAVANVLLNNLLAQPASKWVPSLSILGLSIAYLIALTHYHTSMVMVLQVMGGANLVLLALCAWFTWSGREQGALTQPEPQF